MNRMVVLAPELSKFGGIQKFTNGLLYALVKQFPDTKITVFSLNDTKVDGFQSVPNLQVHCLRSSRIMLVSRLFIHLCQQKPDVIICAHVNFSVLSLFMKLIFKTPYVVITYGIDVWNLKRGFKYQGLRRGDLITSLSRYTSSRMVSNGIPDTKITILHCTVDTDLFIPKKPDPDLVERLGLKGKRVLLSVSRLALTEFEKGHNIMLKTLQILNDEYLWIIVGSGDEIPLLKRQARELGVDHKVRFLGAPETSKLVDFYNLCNLFVFPSKKEGFGIVFIEAMSCGKPVIGGNKDGSLEPLLDGQLGFLVDPDDPKDIAKTIESVFEFSDKRAEASYLTSKVKEVFGLEAFGKRVKEIFSKFLD